MLAFVSWKDIDDLSYGPVDYFVNAFRSWLYRVKRGEIRVLVLPKPRNENEGLSLTFASQIIREEAVRLGFIVRTEQQLRKAGLFKKKIATLAPQPAFKLNTAFEALIVKDNVCSLASTH